MKNAKTIRYLKTYSLLNAFSLKTADFCWLAYRLPDYGPEMRCHVLPKNNRLKIPIHLPIVNHEHDDQDHMPGCTEHTEVVEQNCFR